jgi:two-component system sensor histidine kinase PilS (NtrC family)
MAATIVAKSIAASPTDQGVTERSFRLTAESGLADSYWRSLQYFSIYRLVTGAVFLIAFLLTGGGANLAAQNPTLFLWVDSAYLVAAFAFLMIIQRLRRAFNLQLSIQVACDVAFLTVMMYASGGSKSGIAFMLVVVVAGAALVGQGRLTLFYAALATLAVLIEQTVRTIELEAPQEDFVRTGLISIGFFATALIARMLASRVVANEELARRRGLELAEQIRINRQVIQDMDDGVLVVDGEGVIRLLNPQAEAMLSVAAAPGVPLSQCWPELAAHFRSQQAGDGETTDVLTAPSGRTLLCRRQAADEGANTLVYLQDLGRLQAQAQQIKLAALGRLTANIAHEIRNPLAAITSAGELLADEQRADIRARLVRIIGDNANRLNRLVAEVLDLGRRDRVQPESINLAAFLTQFVEDYSLHEIEAASRIRIEAGSDVVLCFDRTHLFRILENLVTNGLAYASRSPGAVQVKVMAASPESVELHIIDDGPGIPVADRGKVFEPFFTTRSGGTGLGLYIARELCDANGAQLDLVEDPGGAHFRIFAKGGPCRSSSIAGIATM